ncbi:hypothetical protein ACIHDR_46730 [Nocardia sp. NPDC052278]|uniref:hypothetical protein n=1 Tax=unclassified Nocardia TaxID=2637762 RepID=UPI00367EB800
MTTPISPSSYSAHFHAMVARKEALVSSYTAHIHALVERKDAIVIGGLAGSHAVLAAAHVSLLYGAIACLYLLEATFHDARK